MWGLVMERIMPGAVYVDHGARCDLIIPGKLDRGGAINLISPRNTMSKNCLGQATSGYLVEVEKVTHGPDGRMEEAISGSLSPENMIRLPAYALMAGLREV